VEKVLGCNSDCTLDFAALKSVALKRQKSWIVLSNVFFIKIRVLSWIFLSKAFLSILWSWWYRVLKSGMIIACD
jgi:hypothetical protein